MRYEKKGPGILCPPLFTELEHCAPSCPYTFRLNDLTYYLGSFSSDFIYFSTILEKTELFFLKEEPHWFTWWVINANFPISTTLLMVRLKKKIWILYLIFHTNYYMEWDFRLVDFNITFVKNPPIFLAAFYFHLLQKEHQNFAILDKKLNWNWVIIDRYSGLR